MLEERSAERGDADMGDAAAGPAAAAAECIWCLALCADKRALDVFDERADEKYHRRQVIIKAAVAGDGKARVTTPRHESSEVPPSALRP